MSKSIVLAVLIAGIAACASAQTAPIVGLWERLPVTSGDKVVAVPNLVFTNRKLEARTTFTGLQDSGKNLRVICCVEVVNLEPLKTADLVKKYAADADVVEQIKSVKGLAYVYDAAPVDKREWSGFMKNVMQYSDQPALETPFSVPVTTAPLGKVMRVDKAFKVGDSMHELKVVYEKAANQAADRVRYTYKEGSKEVTFSENSPSAE